jgi:hypothetical protein
VISHAFTVLELEARFDVMVVFVDDTAAKSDGSCFARPDPIDRSSILVRRPGLLKIGQKCGS